MTNDEIPKNAEVRMTKGKRFGLWLSSVGVSHFIFTVLIPGVALIFCGCTARYYRKSADKEVYKIIQEKQKAALGQTNAFSIDTAYSPRKPDDIKADEIIADRAREAKQTLTLRDALRIALE